MRNIILSVLITLLFGYGFAKSQLNDKEIEVLAAIGNIYAKGLNSGDSTVSIELNKLKIAKLNGLVETLIKVDSGDSCLLSSLYLKRPGDEDLKFYYALREMAAANRKGIVNDYPNLIKEVLSRRIDAGNLLDNYYYVLKPGISDLIAKKSLNNINIDLNALNLKDDREKAICFLNLIYSMIGPRFLIFETKNNAKSILEFAERTPKFNGANYYEYVNFNYEDFVYLGFNEFESYNERYIGKFYHILLAHIKAYSDSGMKSDAKRIYKKSILSKSEYFKFSKYEKDLKALEEKNK